MKNGLDVRKIECSGSLRALSNLALERGAAALTANM